MFDMPERVEYVDRGFGEGRVQRIQIHLGGVIHSLKPEAALEIAGLIMDLARENGHLDDGPQWYMEAADLDGLDPGKVWFVPGEERISEDPLNGPRMVVWVLLANAVFWLVVGTAIVWLVL